MGNKMKSVPILVTVGLVLSLWAVFPMAQPASAAIGVLFDTGHQREALNISGYSDMTADLTSRGFHFTEDNDGDITEADLSDNHILVIVQPEDALSITEISNIQNFVAAGHSLLLISDRLYTDGREAVNALLSPYNIQQFATLTDRGIYADITSHAITNEVSQYDQDTKGCNFTIVDSPALSLIRDEDGRTLVAASQVDGRIVVLSDESTFQQDSYNNPDNNILMRNVFNWLSHVDPPIADFSAQPTTGLGPLNVHFTDESTGDIDTWQWRFDDSTTSNEPNPSHTYDNVGRYTVSLEVTGVGGTDTAVKTTYIHVIDASGEVAELEPAKFTTLQPNIHPTQVLPNQAVNISINIANHGASTGTYQLVLNINGNFEDSQTVSLSPDSSQSVTFDVTRTTPGTYEVLIDRHEGQFTVIGSTPSSPPSNDVLGTTTIIGIALGSAGAAVFLVIFTRRRRRATAVRDVEDKYRKLLDQLRQL